jgi:hypothetical protein
MGPITAPCGGLVVGEHWVGALVRTETHRRGPIGWVAKGLFVASNIPMFVWLAWSVRVWSGVEQQSTEAGKAGFAIGVGVGVFTILVFWALGSVVLELLSYFTRGNKIIVESEIS